MNTSIQNVLHTIEQTAHRVQRHPHEITLVAVSKTKPLEAILTAYQSGLRHFGENRAQELAYKAQALAHLTDIRWHFIGQLQSRQSKLVAQYAHYFHAVDRLKIAEKLSSHLDHELPVFIEVNISGEETKAGFDLKAWETSEEQRRTFLENLQKIKALKHIKIIGLMTMAEFNAPEAAVRSVFQRLKELLTWVNAQLPELKLTELSMGMSGDFKIAIEEGATFVRIGSAIFGAR